MNKREKKQERKAATHSGKLQTCCPLEIDHFVKASTSCKTP